MTASVIPEMEDVFRAAETGTDYSAEGFDNPGLSEEYEKLVASVCGDIDDNGKRELSPK